MRRQMNRCLGLLLAILLSVSLGFTLSGCENTPANEQPSTTENTAPVTELNKTSFALPFARQDVLNPFALKSLLNRTLTSLMYEGLFLTDKTWKAQPVLAQSIEQSSPLTWLVKLRTDRVFHTGAAVTAADVEYSFLKAKASADYKTRLADVTKCKATQDGIMFTLRSANQYIAANLDFPVVPAGSAEKDRLDEPKGGYLFTKESTPPGTGRYQLTARESSFELVYDKRHPGPAPTLTTIVLYGTNNSSSLLYGLEMGNYQFAYDNLSSGQVERVSATPLRVPTTNLVYLGFNAGRSPLRDAALRAALGACINKSTLLSETFHSYARMTDTPFPPGWFGIQQGDFAKPYNAGSARKTLEDLGYKEIVNGVRCSKYVQLKFKLLTNKDNHAKVSAARAVKTQLAEFQILAEVIALPEKEYLAAAKSGNFDLYIGEIRLTPDCSLAPLLLSGGAATRGIEVWGAASSAYGQLLQGLIPPAKFVSVFQSELPFLPLGYRDGMAVTARNLHVTTDLRMNDLFYDIAQWKYQ